MDRSDLLVSIMYAMPLALGTAVGWFAAVQHWRSLLVLAAFTVLLIALTSAALVWLDQARTGEFQSDEYRGTVGMLVTFAAVYGIVAFPAAFGFGLVVAKVFLKFKGSSA